MKKNHYKHYFDYKVALYIYLRQIMTFLTFPISLKQ